LLEYQVDVTAAGHKCSFLGSRKKPASSSGIHGALKGHTRGEDILHDKERIERERERERER